MGCVSYTQTISHKRSRKFLSAGLSKSKQLSRAKTGSSTIVLANWGRRLVAWFIDYLIINLILGYLGLEKYQILAYPCLSASTSPRIWYFSLVATIYLDFLSLLDFVWMVPRSINWPIAAQYSTRWYSWKKSTYQSCCDSEYRKIIPTPFGLSYWLALQTVSWETATILQQTL